MATTRIMPLHIGKGRTESQAVSDIIDYQEAAHRQELAGRVCPAVGRKEKRLCRVPAFPRGNAGTADRKSQCGPADGIRGGTPE